jgi:hypothetical protein
MALTLQRKLELAGDLSKVQPLLQRLHIVEKPKKRHRVRNVILVSTAIGAGAVVLAVVCRCRGCRNGAVADDGGPSETGSPTQDTPDTGSVLDAAARPT